MSELLTVQIFHSTDRDIHTLNITVRGLGDHDKKYKSSFRLLHNSELEERIRWYLEDFPSNPHASARAWAQRIENELTDFGETLFRGVFSHLGTNGLWPLIKDRLNKTQFEVTSDSPSGYAIPWESMRDPESGGILSIISRSFTRSVPCQFQAPLETSVLPFRILLVISRPLGQRDVPFLVIADELLRLAESSGILVDVLRP